MTYYNFVSTNISQGYSTSIILMPLMKSIFLRHWRKYLKERKSLFRFMTIRVMHSKLFLMCVGKSETYPFFKAQNNKVEFEKKIKEMSLIPITIWTNSAIFIVDTSLLFCRCPDKELVIYPADVVLFEGILVFYFPAIRDLFHMKLFVDTDSDTRLSRRGIILLWFIPAKIWKRW